MRKENRRIANPSEGSTTFGDERHVGEGGAIDLLPIDLLDSLSISFLLEFPSSNRIGFFFCRLFFVLF